MTVAILKRDHDRAITIRFLRAFACCCVLATIAPSVVVSSEQADSHLRLGEALRELERDDEAIDAFRAALAAEPESFAARLNLGTLLTERGDPEALEHLEQAVELNPASLEASYGLAEGLRRQGRWPEALERYQFFVGQAPDDENGRIGEADALFALSRYDDALAKLEEAILAFPDSRGPKFGLTWLLAACPQDGLRDGARALDLAQQLFTERRSVAAAELTAAAQAEVGSCEEAVATQRFVVEQAARFDRPPEVMERLERTLASYESEPCRLPAGRPANERPEWPRRRSAEP